MLYAGGACPVVYHCLSSSLCAGIGYLRERSKKKLQPRMCVWCATPSLGVSTSGRLTCRTNLCAGEATARPPGHAHGPRGPARG
jgi:hypothetical protein